MHVSQIHSYGETNIKCGGVLGLEALHWFWGGFRTTDFVSISSDQITQCGFFFFFLETFRSYQIPTPWMLKNNTKEIYATRVM